MFSIPREATFAFRCLRCCTLWKFSLLTHLPLVASLQSCQGKSEQRNAMLLFFENFYALISQILRPSKSILGCLRVSGSLHQNTYQIHLRLKQDMPVQAALQTRTQIAVSLEYTLNLCLSLLFDSPQTYKPDTRHLTMKSGTAQVDACRLCILYVRQVQREQDTATLLSCHHTYLSTAIQSF